MPLNEGFPRDPYAILDPDIRWYPGEDLLAEQARANLIPPLVDKVRRGVKAWRDSGYRGASDTTRALLRWWGAPGTCDCGRMVNHGHCDAGGCRGVRWVDRLRAMPCSRPQSASFVLPASIVPCGRCSPTS